jgi:hypothetical protein
MIVSGNSVLITEGKMRTTLYPDQPVKPTGNQQAFNQAVKDVVLATCQLL